MNKPRRATTRERRAAWAAFGFLLPNLIGFLGFTLFPVVFSLWMAFTNWSPKPAIHLEFVGLRNFVDLLGMRPIGRGSVPILSAYLSCIAAVPLGIVAALWMARRKNRYAAVVGGLALVVGVAGSILMLGRVGELYEPRDPYFWQFFGNTVTLMLGIPLSIAGSLALAMLLNDKLPMGPPRSRILGAGICIILGISMAAVIWSMGSPNAGLLCGLLWGVAALGFAFDVVAYRTLFYLPTFTAGVALMILWKALYNPQTGPINVALGALFRAVGLHAALPKWLGDVSWAKPAIIAMGVWTSIGGTNMLLYLAGLSNIPRELLDAAEVDGASPARQFRHITWPQLAPTTFFITIMAIIGGLQGGFEQARVMTNGGPAGSTTTLSYYIYNKAFQDLDMGYAAAISWVLFLLVFVATALNWKFGKGLEVD